MSERQQTPRESWIERRIREAVERGEFSDLPGEGEPLEILKEPYEPTWWVKRWMEREGITGAEIREALGKRRRLAP